MVLQVTYRYAHWKSTKDMAHPIFPVFGLTKDSHRSVHEKRYVGV